MSSGINLVNIGGLDDHRVVLGNAMFGRLLDLPGGDPADWKRLRIGCRICVDDSGGNLSANPIMWVGVMTTPTANMANGPLLSSAGHCIGGLTLHSTWTRNAGPPVRYAAGATIGYLLRKKVGSTITDGGASTLASAPQYSAAPTANRPPIIFDFEKTATSLSMTAAANTLTTVPDESLTDLETAMEMPGIADAAASIGLIVGTTVSVAIDEGVDGDLNSIFFAWNRTSPRMYFSEIKYAIFS